MFNVQCMYIFDIQKQQQKTNYFFFFPPPFVRLQQYKKNKTPWGLIDKYVLLDSVSSSEA